MAATLLAYSNSVHGVFVFDDRQEIRDNPAIRHLWPPGEAMFGGPGLPRRPIPYYTFALNFAWGGTDVRGYHAVNIAIHVAAALVLFGIVRRTLRMPRFDGRYESAADGLALAAALVWAVHPLGTQAVTYVYQRLESLMGLFYLLTLYSFIRSIDTPRPRSWIGCSFLWCAAGMGCKEVMVTAPLILVWYDVVFVARSWRDMLQRRAAFHAATFATWLILWAVVRCQASRYRELESPLHTPLQYALNQSAVVLHYLLLAAWPRGQCLYDRWPVQSAAQLIGPVLAMAVVLSLVAWAAIKRPALGFVAGTFFLILAPTSSFLPVHELAFEHRMYLPLASLAVLAVLAAHCVFSSRMPSLPGNPLDRSRAWAGPVVTAAVVVALVATTRARNTVYASAVTMWRDVVSKSPRNPVALENLGVVLAEARDDREAIDCFQRALTVAAGDSGITPRWRAEVLSNLGASLGRIGALDEARDRFQQAVELDPGFGSPLINLGILAARAGEHAQARRSFERAIELQPQSVTAYVNLALVLEETGAEGAFGLYEKALDLNPGHAPTHAALGHSLLRRGDVFRAIACLKRALALDPSLAAARRDLEIAQRRSPDKP